MWIKNRNYFQSKKNQEFFLILIKLGFFNILILLPKHPYYRPVKNWPNYHYYRPQKIEEIAEKKVVRNFLTNLIFLFFFEFFSENVLKTLLRGRETTRKKYRIVFEKCWKYMIFFDFACPPITHPSITHPSITHPSVNTSLASLGGPRRGPIWRASRAARFARDGALRARRALRARLRASRA